jgi:hypothetical protein
MHARVMRMAPRVAVGPPSPAPRSSLGLHGGRTQPSPISKGVCRPSQVASMHACVRALESIHAF